MKNLNTWKNLDEFNFSKLDCDLSFSTRLMRENQWTQVYADRVVHEYKRFAYLASVSDAPVTPSDQVDQAWHLHLIYTRNYWGAFTEILGKPLHHGPTNGGKIEADKYADQYQFTLDRYNEEFGEEPPSDIWPTAEERFSPNQHFIRLNAYEHFIVSKPNFSVRSVAAALSVLTLCGVAVGGYTSADAAEIFGREFTTKSVFTGLSITILVLFLLYGLRLFLFGEKKKRRNGKDGGSGQGPGTGCGTGCGSGCGGGGCGN